MASKYSHILTARRPVHDFDGFSHRHPPMPRGKRAKLFAPFDALSGYDEALANVETIYVARPLPDETKQHERDEQLKNLWQLYCKRKSGCKFMGPDRQSKSYDPPVVTLTYFKEASGRGGYGTMVQVTGNLIFMDLRHRLLRMEIFLNDRANHAEIVSIPIPDIYDCTITASCHLTGVV